MLSQGLRLRLGILLLALCSAVPMFAKDTTIDWPETGTPVLRFSFGKFHSLPEMGPMHAYVMHTTAQNLSSRVIAAARFKVYLFDKKNVRVSDDIIALSNLGPGETVKFETTISAADQPASIKLEEIAPEKKTVSLTVVTTPAGATLSVDGNAVGTTPRLISVGPGHHTLTFAKEGFNSGNFPLDISPNDVSGGRVAFDLGASAHDTIELRDGSVLTGDLVSISGMDVELRIGGALQHISRNQVKRVLLVQREAPKQDNLPNATQ